jgi:predicted transposase YbfD/YdcC
LALKANQGTIKDDVEDLFRIQKSEDKANTLEKNRVRIENRTCEVIRDFDQLENIEKWDGLKSITKISSIVEVGEKKSTETRLYISSLESSVEDLKQYIRQHWGIENSLH